MQLDDVHHFILGSLSKCCPSSGMTVGDFSPWIGRQPFALSNRQHSNWISGLLHQLENEGLVKRMDDKKPIVWQITVKGANYGD